MRLLAALRDATHWDEARLRAPAASQSAAHRAALASRRARPVHVLRKTAGHGSLSTTQRYLHHVDQSIADARDALSTHFGVPVPDGPQLRVV